MAQRQLISREEMGQVIRSKKHFYNAMQQDGWVLPAFK